MKRRALSCTLLSIAICFGSSEHTAPHARLIPRLINYQGYLTDTLGIPVDDSLDMTFTIYDALSGGNQLWSESWHDVVVEQGVFSVLIGDQETLPDSVFTDFANIWLELILNGTQTLSPRTRITAVGYAYTSVYSDTAEYARTAPGDNDWVVSGNRLYPGEEYGLAMRSSNVMYGAHLNTHVNFGVACTTGTLMRDYEYCTVGGGYRNGATYSSATVAGGSQNRAGYHYAVVGGGRANYNAGYYSVIAGGYADTITLTGDYSYLFGINANLTQDSTFMVDLPHIRFGDESAGYEFPVTDGSNGQALVTNGSGRLSWTDGSSLENWFEIDSVLYTNNYWSVARGGADNVLYGDSAHSHINLGAVCTTGVNGQNMSHCTISGGYGNAGSDNKTTAGGGMSNSASMSHATIAGGSDNTASEYYSVVSGGSMNFASGLQTSVCGGEFNNAYGTQSTVIGGSSNLSAGTGAVVGGGYANYSHYNVTTVWGGFTNRADDEFATVGCGAENWADEAYAAIGGGLLNRANWDYATAIGGSHNNAHGHYSTVIGGFADTVRAEYGGIASGWHNTTGDALTDTAAFVGGGSRNVAFAQCATVTSGYADTVLANYGGIASGWRNTTGSTPADLAAFVGGGAENATTAQYATVSGGRSNSVQTEYGGIAAGRVNTGGDASTDTAAFVGGGRHNRVYAQYGCVAGGADNVVNAGYAAVGTGIHNSTGAGFSVSCGGGHNSVLGQYAAVGGGLDNQASAQYTVVGGGYENLASGEYATIMGGYADTSAAFAAYAANYTAKVNIGDTNSAAFTTSHTTAPNQVRAAAFSVGNLVFSMDHPANPGNMILNQYALGSPDALLLYNGSAVIKENGQVEVFLPDYFEKINRDPHIQLTGVGSSNVVFVAEDIKGNSFVIGGTPGMKVYWTVTAERADIHAEIARIQTPAEQTKTVDLMGYSLDGDISTKIKEAQLLEED
jgi:hypothetical protein